MYGSLFSEIISTLHLNLLEFKRSGLDCRSTPKRARKTSIKSDLSASGIESPIEVKKQYETIGEAAYRPDIKRANRRKHRRRPVQLLRKHRRRFPLKSCGDWNRLDFLSDVADKACGTKTPTANHAFVGSTRLVHRFSTVEEVSSTIDLIHFHRIFLLVTLHRAYVYARRCAEIRA